MGHFHFLPSHPHAAPLNYGVGLGNDPNISNFQMEAHKKVLQQQIEVQSHFLFFLHIVTGICPIGFI